MVLIDGRPEPQYTGAEPGIAFHTNKPHKRLGHIESAISIPWKANFTEDGDFKSVEIASDLRRGRSNPRSAYRDLLQRGPACGAHLVCPQGAAGISKRKTLRRFDGRVGEPVRHTDGADRKDVGLMDRRRGNGFSRDANRATDRSARFIVLPSESRKISLNYLYSSAII